MKKKLHILFLCLALIITAVPVTSVSVSAETTKSYTGWKTSGGKKYYYKNGKRLTGFRKIGKWYYCFDSSGAMRTGWVRVSNKFRYFGKGTGRMHCNDTIAGRKTGKNGVWTPVIVLDPGHSSIVASGSEPLGPGSSQLKSKDTSGTQGVATGVPEYRLNFTIAQSLKTVLEKRGYKVILTRTTNNIALSCIQRAQIANNAKADAFVRIHANGSSSSSANGAMTICTTKNNPYAPSLYKKSKALSSEILDAYVKSTGCRREYIWETDSMSGNNWSKVPVTIIEMGYMSNPAEDRLMQTASYQKKMVAGIAAGIDNYILKY